MTSPQGLSSAVAWLAALVAAGCSEPAQTPNVVVVVVDTLRADRLAAYGHEHDTSPFLTDLAERSVVFENAWSTSSWTAPATASLFTGLYPTQHGVLTGLSLFRRNQIFDDWVGTTSELNTIPPELETLPELFRGLGYRTYGVADNINVCAEEGFASGFGRFDPGDYRGARAVVDRVLAWKDELADESAPYFLYVHLLDPHQPYHDRGAVFDWDALEPGDRAWLEELVDEPCPHCETARSLSSVRVSRAASFPGDPEGSEGPEGPDESDTTDEVAQRRRVLAERLLRAHYDSEIGFVDTQLERLFSELGLEPDTLVVFTSDHGEEFGDHGMYGHPFALYDEHLRVPLFVRLPGDDAPRGRRAHPASLVDVLPTLRELVGAPPSSSPIPVAGRSLADALRGDASVERDLFAVRAHERPVKTSWKRALRSGDYKLILEQPDERAQLFDVAADPGETRDLADEQPERVRELSRRLEHFDGALEAVERRFVPIEMDQATRESLERLGYIGDEQPTPVPPARDQ